MISSGGVVPAAMKVFVMRGSGSVAKLSRRPFPVGAARMSRALVRSCMKPVRIPSSIRVVRRVGSPSSSTFKDPRRPGSVPSSTTVTPGEATLSPNFFEKTEVPLRMKSASSPCPTAS